MPAQPPGPDLRDRDQRRTAGLLLGADLDAGRIAEPALGLPAVRRATRVRPIPGAMARTAQLGLRKLGLLDYGRVVVAPQRSARAAALGLDGPGAVAEAPPRLLVRVDEFPHYQAWDEPRRFGTDAFERFRQIMSDAGVPYLIAALPRVSRSPLSPQALGSRPLEEGEARTLRDLAEEGVTLALHGLDHRTRDASPRRHSELCGLDAEQTEQLIERALAELAAHGLPRPDVFVAPYNRFDASQLKVLAGYFAVVCGGPESIGTLGFQRPPQWRGETVYLPGYAPFYGHAAQVIEALDRYADRIAGLWTPVVLHWGWEADAGWRDLERLAERMAGSAVPWRSFLSAVEQSSREGAVA
ncbi:MAG TPA: DUF2334 domain-containing protein [Solirubrobacteraceae bacterium]|nr:DUF2334 domain-containing protein [Solirubrobacteraceae bacterium]